MKVKKGDICITKTPSQESYSFDSALIWVIMIDGNFLKGVIIDSGNLDGKNVERWLWSYFIHEIDKVIDNAEVDFEVKNLLTPKAFPFR